MGVGNRIRRNARAFLIWRTGEAYSWQCTARTIREETGIDLTTIRRICKERGWPLLEDRPGRKRTRKPRFYEDAGLPDLCEIFGGQVNAT